MRDDEDNERRAWLRRRESRGPLLRQRDPAAEAPPPHLELSPCREGAGFRVFELLPRTTFSWSNVTGGGRLTYDLSAYVPVVGTPEAVLTVRVHEKTMATGPRAELVLELVGLSSDDPETIFVWAHPLARIVVQRTTPEGICINARLRADLGTHLRAVLHLHQAAISASAAVTLSAELLTRTAAEQEVCSCSPG